jgi:hypothetical protein
MNTEAPPMPRTNWFSQGTTPVGPSMPTREARTADPPPGVPVRYAPLTKEERDALQESLGLEEELVELDPANGRSE